MRLRSTTPDARPDFSRALHLLTVALIESSADLSSLKASAIIVVPLSAHGTVAASVRGLDDVATKVTVARVVKRWEIGLRPPFFLGADPSSRLSTFIHELLHIDPNGGLLESRRHAKRSHHDHEVHARALARDAIDTLDVRLLAPLGHHGEVLLPAWRVRPTTTTRTRAFTARDLYSTPVVMETPARHRTVWW